MTLAVIVGVFAVVATVQAATTISTNISTGGTLDVTGLSSLGQASSTMLSANTAYFGGTATTTISAAGVASFPSTISVSATSSLATTTVNRFLVVGSTTPQHGRSDVLIDGTATTTLQLSTSGAATVGTCIQMKSVAGANTRIYVNAAGTGLIVEAGLCK